MTIEEGSFAVIFLKHADGIYQRISINLASITVGSITRDSKFPTVSCEGYINNIESQNAIDSRELEKEWEEIILGGIKKS